MNRRSFLGSLAALVAPKPQVPYDPRPPYPSPRYQSDWKLEYGVNEVRNYTQIFRRTITIERVYPPAHDDAIPDNLWWPL